MTEIQPSGNIVPIGYGARIDVSRVFPHDQEVTWSYLTESDKLGQWYGTFTGDPADGTVDVLFVETPEDTDPMTVEINTCEAPNRLQVELPSGWVINVSLAPHPDGTHVVLTQLLSGEWSEQSGEIGVGWEYYLARWAATLAGEDLDEIEWDDYSDSLFDHYSLEDDEEDEDDDEEEGEWN